MARSVWKGPFVEESLIKKVDKQKKDTNKKPIKTWSTTLLVNFVLIFSSTRISLSSTEFLSSEYELFIRFFN